MVGSGHKSKGGITSVLNLLKESNLWKEFQCYWLGTQIQASIITKITYCIRAYFIALIKIHHYDIIHFHTVPGKSLKIQFPIFIIAKLFHKKIILHFHSGGNSFNRGEDKLLKYCLTKSNYIILLSKSIENDLHRLFPNIKTPTITIYNPCKNVKCIPYNTREKVIIFSGILNHNKAYDILLKAFSLISNKYPDWKLVFMGNGDIEKAQNLAHELNIHKQTVFKGYIGGAEKEQTYQTASILCLCSYKEGFPMAVIEAWSYGIPVITTPAGGLPEVLQNRHNALIFDFGDYEMLAEKLDILMSDYNLREYMSHYSIQFALDNFNINHISVQLAKLYRTII